MARQGAVCDPGPVSPGSCRPAPPAL